MRGVGVAGSRRDARGRWAACGQTSGRLRDGGRAPGAPRRGSARGGRGGAARPGGVVPPRLDRPGAGLGPGAGPGAAVSPGAGGGGFGVDVTAHLCDVWLSGRLLSSRFPLRRGRREILSVRWELQSRHSTSVRPTPDVRASFSQSRAGTDPVPELLQVTV